MSRLQLPAARSRFMPLSMRKPILTSTLILVLGERRNILGKVVIQVEVRTLREDPGLILEHRSQMETTIAK
jgi:hypothetical protein